MAKKGKLNPHASPTSGHSLCRDIGCLLALTSQYKPLTVSPFGAALSHYEVPWNREAGIYSHLILVLCVSGFQSQAHRRVKVK